MFSDLSRKHLSTTKGPVLACLNERDGILVKELFNSARSVNGIDAKRPLGARLFELDQL